MKRLLFIILVLVFSLSLFASEEWTISTSQGDKTLVIPEGYTLEEAYCKMAQFYWEERYDREELQSIVESLTIKSEEYLKENESLKESYSKLNSNYKELTGLYEEKLKTPFARWTLSAGVSNSLERVNDTIISLYGGTFFADSVMFEVGVSFPWRLSVKVGFVF